MSIRQILAGEYGGKTVKINGDVHNIRDMGGFALVILRKAEGLVERVSERFNRGVGGRSDRHGGSGEARAPRL